MVLIAAFYCIHILLDAVWKKGENTRFEENRDHILALMEHLNIIARPIPNTENEDACDCDTIQVCAFDNYHHNCRLVHASNATRVAFGKVMILFNTFHGSNIVG